MSGRINQLIVNIIVSSIKDAIPGKLQTESAALLAVNYEDGFPLQPYRQFLQAVRQSCGDQTILAAGKGLGAVSDPFLFVLLNSDTVPLVIEKEARLGRFIHSRHVVRLVESLENGVLLEHVSNEPEDPLPEESLASAGLHISLLEQLGCNNLRLRFPESNNPDQWVYTNGEYNPFSDLSGVIQWHFEWENFTPVRKPMAGLDALLLSKEDRPELAEAPEIVLRVLQVVQVDMARTWTINDVAKRISRSPRSLQRSLTLAGTSFSKMITEWRLAEARRLLCATELSVTDIGYICGFSDTSHFSRRFKAFYGESPSRYPRDNM